MKIEREISARRVALVVVAPNTNYQRQATLGLIYVLRSAGYAPESHSWVSQIGRAYYYGGGPVTHVTVFAYKGGEKTRVVITGVPGVRP
jgi:hypothetical protein